jgi:hypothetical protein
VEVLRLQRSALKFPARCLGCLARSTQRTVSWPSRWRKKRRIDLPVCGVCAVRLQVARPVGNLVVGATGMAIVATALGDGIALAGLSLWWWIVAGCVLFVAVAGKPLTRLPWVLHADENKIELGFDDPIVAAEMVAASHAQPYRGTALASLERRYGWVTRMRRSRWFALLKRPLW